MSSISLPYEKQIKHMFPFTAVATETTEATFISGASNGEIQLFRETGTTTGKGGFYFLKKDATGKVVKSDLVKPKNITYLRGSAPVAKVGKVQAFTLSGVTVGAVYGLSLKINYANSEQNFEYLYASTKAVTGDTANTLLRRLAKQLADGLANSMYTNTAISGDDTIASSPAVTARKNKYFTITVATSTLTITEKNWILDGYVTGLKTFDQLMWNAEIETKNDTAFAQVSKTSSTPVYARNQGYQMLEMERYLVGHRAEFPGPDITLSFTRAYEVNVNSAYYALDMRYFDVSRNDPYQSDKEILLVSTDAEAVDALGYRIETLMGGAEGTIWNELDSAQDGSDNV